MPPEKGPVKKHPCGRPLGFRRIIEVLVKQREPVTAREILNCDPRLKSVSSVVGLILNHNDGAIIKIGQKNGPTLYTLSETERARWGVDMDERTGGSRKNAPRKIFGGYAGRNEDTGRRKL